MTVILIAQNQATAPANNRYETDMVADYLFESIPGSQTTVFDQTPDQYNLTIETPANTSWETGPYGQYLQVNDECKIIGGRGFSQFLTPAKASGEFTIECWVAIHDHSLSLLEQGETVLHGPARMVNCSDPADSTGSRNFLLGINTWPAGAEEGVIRTRLRTDQSNLDGAPEIATAGGAVANENLHHIVWTYEKGVGQRVYINEVAGTFSQSVVSSAPENAGELESWDSTYQLLLGTEHDAPRIFRGEFHRISFHDAALTPQQVEQNYYALPSGSGVLPAPSVGWRSSTYASDEWLTNFTADIDLNVPAQGATTVNLSITGTTDMFLDAGLTQTTGTVVVADGAITAPVSIYTRDTSSGGAYTGTLNVLSGTGYDVGSPASSTVTVATDNVLPAISWVSTTATAPIDGVLNLTLTASLPWNVDNTVFLGVNGGLTTMSGGDYTVTDPTILEHDLEVDVPVTFNGTAADGETLVLDILSMQAGTFGTISRVTITASDLTVAQPGPSNTGTSGTLAVTGGIDLTDAWILANATLVSPGQYEFTDFSITSDDIVIDWADLSGAHSITFRNGKIDAGGGNHCVRMYGDNSGKANTVTFDHCELTNAGDAVNNTATSRIGGLLEITHCEIHECDGDAIKTLNATRITRNWMHHLGRVSGAHADGVQMYSPSGGPFGNVYIEENFFDIPVPESPAAIAQGAGSPYSSNAALINTILVNYIDVKFNRNWADGGNFTTYFLIGSGYTFDQAEMIGNRFGRNFRYGLLSADNGITNRDFRDNVWDDTGALILAGDTNYNGSAVLAGSPNLDQ